MKKARESVLFFKERMIYQGYDIRFAYELIEGGADALRFCPLPAFGPLFTSVVAWIVRNYLILLLSSVCVQTGYLKIYIQEFAGITPCFFAFGQGVAADC